MEEHRALDLARGFFLYRALTFCFELGLRVSSFASDFRFRVLMFQSFGLQGLGSGNSVKGLGFRVS